VNQKKFERIVEQAIADLPEEFRARLENVAVLIEEEPGEELLKDLGMDEDEELFGLFDGEPLTERSGDVSMGGVASGPARVYIFRGPLLRSFTDEPELRDEIRDTLVHEIGHFFGLDDDEMPY